MRILGGDLRDLEAGEGDATLVLLDERGALSASTRAADVAALAQETGRLAGGEPFLLAVDAPVAGAGAGTKPRRVDGWILRRLGVRLPHARRGVASRVAGPDLLAALATAGIPCLPYPDRDRRRAGLGEIHPELVLKSLLWERSAAASAASVEDREGVLRALALPDYRGTRLARSSAAERWAAVDFAISVASSAEGTDLKPVADELVRASNPKAIARAASLLDACLLAAAARRYVEEPERCAFVGDRESGYTILPADGFVRRVVLRETAGAAERAPLFPKASLQQRLGPHATLRPLELIDLPGRAARMEAVFEKPPLYEFDNLDEMMWWKHCRHLSGPDVPIDGLDEMVVRLDAEASDSGGTLRLVRSRHKTLSFRFEPPQSWRLRIPPRDGKTYPFRVLRAVFEAARG